MSSNFSSKNVEIGDIGTRNITFSVMKVDHVNLNNKMSTKIDNLREISDTYVGEEECPVDYKVLYHEDLKLEGNYYLKLCYIDGMKYIIW